ncbi:MAG: nascent polypeptide-associated complex protein [Deltaproteobacteria bacterium]|nr:MAG: nascent polypeptide-associated complex protein [Thermoplasmatales archaeon ex4484_6]RLB22750.1 MAG: nascent polypeptide-associated complex protein [Deltaproteobacteria bacterium]RLF68354.1 MAG: nascent polypeptide-associated complex protein [Thermoplasmata archaeon]HHD15780.1 nascent polypeptide-associated complex protein [Euryarchaeota archaeon]
MPGRMNPRQMERMMRKMGLNMEELKDVRKVVIETGSKEIVIENPAVTIMNVQGERTFQIQGKVSERSLGTEIPEEDIQLVMDQTGADRASALKALEESEGEPAEAIIKLMG